MKTITIETPALFGDHHVAEVRRLLFEIPGVEDVYASSAFQTVEVTYDPAKVGVEKIENALQEMGYLQPLELPVEADAATYLKGDRSKSYFRHTAVYENSQDVVSFAQNVSFSGRPLWNCPGFGVIKTEMED